MLAVVLSASCAGSRGGSLNTGAMAFDDVRVRRIVLAALEAEAAGSGSDSLYLAETIIVSNGRIRRTPPRLAGMATGGNVRLLETLVEITPGLAWVSARYQWMSGENRSVETGRATFILVPVGGDWKIRHAHSSTVLPWESER